MGLMKCLTLAGLLALSSSCSKQYIPIKSNEVERQNKYSLISIDSNLKYPEEEMYYNFMPDSSLMYFPQEQINYDSLESNFFDYNSFDSYDEEEGW